MATSQLNILHAGLFAGSILGLAAVAGSRAAPFQPPVGADLLDGTVAKALETQYDARFPVKTLGINLWAAIDYGLFNEGRPGVIVGEDGWLYSNEEFLTYADADTQLAKHLDLIPDVRRQLSARGTTLLIAALPAKARLYPEHLGTHQPARVHATLYERLRATAHAAGVPAPDLAATLSACKRSDAVFLRTDTHWTPAGARCAAQALGATAAGIGLNLPGPARYRTERAEPVAHQGDLLRYLPLAPYLSALLPPPDLVAFERSEPVSGGDLLGGALAPQIVLVGTSYSADSRWNFAGALATALGEDVVSYAATGQGPFTPMLDYLRSADFRSAPPRLLIWEIPERYLPAGSTLTPSAQSAAGAIHHLLQPAQEIAT